jgi:segregation and condensation protein B
MMETLAIVAYRQPITRPEIDEIRGVDCGPVLRTLLDRALIRVLGKREEVGRPMLYGTTPEFLKIFSLRDLAELPTLREFHELGADDRAKVDATATATTLDSATSTVGAADLLTGVAAAAGSLSGAPPLSELDPAEEDALLEALENAAEAAGRAGRSFTDSTDSESGAPDSEDEPVAPAPPSDARNH